MRRLLLAGLMGLSCLLFLTSSASAHILKTDGTIGAVLHIDPDDNPVSGNLTSYDLEFKDTTGKFTLSACDCLVTIQQGGQAIYSHRLALTSQTTSQNSFTFPNADIYDLVITGRPKSVGDFRAFKLDYVVRVTGGSQLRPNQPFPVLLRFGMSLMIALILLNVYKVLHKANGL